MDNSLFSTDPKRFLIKLPADLDAGDHALWRVHLLECRRKNIPTAALLQLDADLPDEQRYFICEFLQYVELCITDCQSAAKILQMPNDAAPQYDILRQKLFSRFAFGGIVLTDRNYACLNTVPAQALFSQLRPIPAKINPTTR